MIVDKDLVISSEPHVLWDVLWDVSRIASCIRGCSDVQVLDPRRRYSAVLDQSVGPFHVSFPLNIEVTDIKPHERIAVEATGRDAKLASQIKATMGLSLTRVGDRSTMLHIHTDLAIRGRLATLGQGIVSRKADEELRYFSACLEEELADLPQVAQ
jgi:carbon monoxide dehydrogenase subunit G